MNSRPSDARIQDEPAPVRTPTGDSAPPAGTPGLRAVVSKPGAPSETGSRAGELASITQRIGRLERQNRWLKLSIVLIFAFAALYVTNMVLPPDTIVKQTLVESKELKLLDTDGTPRLFLRMYSRVPVLQLLDKNGKPRMSLGLRFDDTPFLDLSDPTGRTRVLLELNEQGEPLIELFDKNGHSTTRIR